MSVDTIKTPTLDGTEVCDRDGVAKAFVRTTFRSGLYLDWCGHHYNANAESLVHGPDPVTHVQDNRTPEEALS